MLKFLINEQVCIIACMVVEIKSDIELKLLFVSASMC